VLFCASSVLPSIGLIWIMCYIARCHSTQRIFWRSFFVERECINFPAPVNFPAPMKVLETLPASELAPRFVAAGSTFSDFIRRNARTKCVEGGSLTGASFALLAREVTDKVTRPQKPFLFDTNPALNSVSVRPWQGCFSTSRVGHRKVLHFFRLRSCSQINNKPDTDYILL